MLYRIDTTEGVRSFSIGILVSVHLNTTYLCTHRGYSRQSQKSAAAAAEIVRPHEERGAPEKKGDVQDQGMVSFQSRLALQRDHPD